MAPCARLCSSPSQHIYGLSTKRPEPCIFPSYFHQSMGDKGHKFDCRRTWQWASCLAGQRSYAVCWLDAISQQGMQSSVSPQSLLCALPAQPRRYWRTPPLCSVFNRLLVQAETSQALSQPAKSDLTPADLHSVFKQSRSIWASQGLRWLHSVLSYVSGDGLCTGCEVTKSAPHPVTRCAAGAGAGPAAQACSAAGVVGCARAALGLAAPRRAGLRQGELAPGAPGGAAGRRAGTLCWAGACRTNFAHSSVFTTHLKCMLAEQQP